MASICMQRAVSRTSGLMAGAVRSARAPTVVNRLGASQARCFSQSFQRFEKRYTESHEWVELAADGKTCKIGISKYAAEALGDVVYVEVPEKGDEVTEGESFGSVESVKSASDIVSPVSGTVSAVNQPLAEKPADLGKDPEGEGWMIEVETTEANVDSLMDAAKYAEFTADQ